MISGSLLGADKEVAVGGPKSCFKRGSDISAENVSFPHVGKLKHSGT